MNAFCCLSHDEPTPDDDEEDPQVDRFISSEMHTIHKRGDGFLAGFHSCPVGAASSIAPLQTLPAEEHWITTRTSFVRTACVCVCV